MNVKRPLFHAFLVLGSASIGACSSDGSGTKDKTDAGDAAPATGGSSGNGTGGRGSGGAPESGGSSGDAGPSTGGAGGSSAGDAGPDSEGGPESDSGGDATATDSGDSSTAEGGDTQAPALTNLTWIENPKNHLSGFVQFDTDEPAVVTLSVSDAAGYSVSVPTPSTPSMHHDLFVMGLKASTEFTFSITATDAAGNPTLDTSLKQTPGPLPADFPPMELVKTTPGSMQPGFTLFDVFRWTPGTDRTWGLALIVDAQGDVVWYRKVDEQVIDLRRLSNGNLLYGAGDTGAVELDMQGTELHRWSGAALGMDTMHHEIYELPNGHFLSLGTELRSISGYNGGADTFDVVGDIPYEFTRDGQVTWSAKLLDLLDPLRTTPDFYTPFWNATYPNATSGTKDWSHSNAIIYDASDDSMIVSVRHQDYLVKIDRAGNLVWKFGEGGDFTMKSGGDFPFHAHAPELEANGNILLFDNGNGRSTLAVGETPYSRVAEFKLDTSGADAGGFTAEQVWEFRDSPPYFAPFIGDADRMGNGNVLITDGGLVADPTKGPGDPTNKKFARIVEVTGGASPQVLFDFRMEDKSTTNPVGYSIYRSERLPALYP